METTSLCDDAICAPACTPAPMCYFCSSTDTMEPFQRSDHVPILSTVFPRLRLRYCRQCTRHFLSVLPDRAL